MRITIPTGRETVAFKKNDSWSPLLCGATYNVHSSPHSGRRYIPTIYSLARLYHRPHYSQLGQALAEGPSKPFYYSLTEASLCFKQ